MGPSVMCGCDRRLVIYGYGFCLDVPSHVWLGGVGLGVNWEAGKPVVPSLCIAVNENLHNVWILSKSGDWGSGVQFKV